MEISSNDIRGKSVTKARSGKASGEVSLDLWGNLSIYTNHVTNYLAFADWDFKARAALEGTDNYTKDFFTKDGMYKYLDKHIADASGRSRIKLEEMYQWADGLQNNLQAAAVGWKPSVILGNLSQVWATFSYGNFSTATKILKNISSDIARNGNLEESKGLMKKYSPATYKKYFSRVGEVELQKQKFKKLTAAQQIKKVGRLGNDATNNFLSTLIYNSAFETEMKNNNYEWGNESHMEKAGMLASEAVNETLPSISAIGTSPLYRGVMGKF